MTDRSNSVAILLATFNGARFIDEQLASIAAQTLPSIHIYASDDGSSDATVSRLRQWQQNWSKGRFEIAVGPGKGFAENFRSLMQVDRDTDYVAFSDQDDIWDPDKLEAAISRLERLPEGLKLYVSRTRLVDETGRFIGYSPLFRRPPDFRNALVQNIGGGNTAVLNRAGARLVAESARRTSFVSHDWWCYLMVTGAGGTVIYDPVPHIGYRQHDGNLVGSNVGLGPAFTRMGMALGGRFKAWNDMNLAVLDRCRDLLSPISLRTLDFYEGARRGGLRARVRNLKLSHVYRQSLRGSLSLWAACMLNLV